MPYEIRWEPPVGVHARFTGRIRPADFARLSEDVTSDERFDDLRYALGDFRDVTGHDFDLTDRNSMTAPYALLIGASHTNANIHVALVISDPGIVELMQRSIAIGVLAYPVQIFDKESAARDWLNSISGSFRRPDFSR